MFDATAFWIEAPGVGALRRQRVPDPAPGEVLVRTRYTALSRGTETTVFAGRVPASERTRMRAPFQEGEFPGPVKYGYLNVGVVEGGSAGCAELVGRTVFTLFPHQSAFAVPAAAAIPVPDGVPARRAVLAGAVETAVNVLWDAAPLLGDRIAIVGAGMIGCCVARLAAGIPGARVSLVDIDPARRSVADRLGVRFLLPGEAVRGDAQHGGRGDAADAGHASDVVIETSGSESGLRLAMELAADDGEVIVASWFGDRPVALMLGADFHSRRLTLRASQVGAVSPRRRDRRTTGERLALALELLRDHAFDALLTGTSSWRELPETMARLAAPSSAPPSARPSTLSGREICHTIDWSEA